VGDFFQAHGEEYTATWMATPFKSHTHFEGSTSLS
jgi:hypothetical protein